jgi:hypothetical protein
MGYLVVKVVWNTLMVMYMKVISKKVYLMAKELLYTVMDLDGQVNFFKVHQQFLKSNKRLVIIKASHSSYSLQQSFNLRGWAQEVQLKIEFTN